MWSGNVDVEGRCGWARISTDGTFACLLSRVFSLYSSVYDAE